MDALADPDTHVILTWCYSLHNIHGVPVPDAKWVDLPLPFALPNNFSAQKVIQLFNKKLEKYFFDGQWTNKADGTSVLRCYKASEVFLRPSRP